MLTVTNNIDFFKKLMLLVIIQKPMLTAITTSILGKLWISEYPIQFSVIPKKEAQSVILRNAWDVSDSPRGFKDNWKMIIVYL